MVVWEESSKSKEQVEEGNMVVSMISDKRLRPVSEEDNDGLFTVNRKSSQFLRSLSDSNDKAEIMSLLSEDKSENFEVQLVCKKEMTSLG